jgi:hypothetical protein
LHLPRNGTARAARGQGIRDLRGGEVGEQEEGRRIDAMGLHDLGNDAQISWMQRFKPEQLLQLCGLGRIVNLSRG